MAEGSVSTSDLLPYVLGPLFDSSGRETTSDDDVRNYNDVGDLSNETDLDSGSSFIYTPVMMKVTA